MDFSIQKNSFPKEVAGLPGDQVTQPARAHIEKNLNGCQVFGFVHFSATQWGCRVVQLLVDRVDMSADGVDIRLRTEGLANLTLELNVIRPEQEAA